MTARDGSLGNPPLVSVGVPVYNGEAHLGTALESLLAQRYPSLEVVISDNGSTDGTEEICRAAAARDPRVRYHRMQENVGAWANFGHVFDLARGEYFMWAGHHDLWDPLFVPSCAAALDTDPDAVIAYPIVSYIDPDGRPLPGREPAIDTTGSPTADRIARTIEEYPNCAMYGLMRSSALRRIRSDHGLGLNRPLSHVGPDTLVLLRLAGIGGFALVPKPLFYNRLFGVNWSYERKLEQLVPGRGIHANWAQWAFVRDALEVIMVAEIDVGDKVRLARLFAHKWMLPQKRRLLYELDVLRMVSRTKHLARKLMGVPAAR